jgi:hypothetical protein
MIVFKQLNKRYTAHPKVVWLNCIIQRIIIFVAITFAFEGCMMYRYTATGDFFLRSVNTNGEKEVKIIGSQYSDSTVTFRVNMSEKYIKLVVANNSTVLLKVLWDEGAYIDERGNAHRIIHTGTKFIDKEKAQVPSVVPKDSQISEIIAPADYIEYNEATLSWDYSPLISFSSEYKTANDARESLEYIGPVKLMIPLESNGVRQEYTFTFTIGNINVNEQRKVDPSSILVAILCGVPAVIYPTCIILGLIQNSKEK